LSTPVDLPSEELFAGVVGQRAAIELLRASARRPVHAYLFVGKSATSDSPLVRGFAAALLCPLGGDGSCEVCRRALSGVHPDLVEIWRTGASLSVEDIQRVVHQAQRRPMEGHRQVLVVNDIHLARVAAPALLKTLEEPPGDTVFLLLADSIGPELATITSRCVRIDLSPVSIRDIIDMLTEDGIEPNLAAEVAEASDGSAQRALLLARDPGFANRRVLWSSVPKRLDGTGAAAANLVAELIGSADAAVEPLKNRQALELSRFTEASTALGVRSATATKQMEERHNREQRRWRTDELRAGLAVLSSAYRDRLVSVISSDQATSGTPEAPPPGRTAERIARLSSAVELVEQASKDLSRNPNEALMLQDLAVRLSAATG
jgi:DNA polymerase-3 subunit delta'